MGVKTTEKDLGYKRILDEVDFIKRNGQPHVNVGFQGTSALQKHPGSESKATVVDIATFNEFGTITAPERSFIRSTMFEKFKELTQFNQVLFGQIVEGKMSTLKALEILGIKIKSLIQRKITDLKDPPNAPTTIRKKGSSNPLIDTGQMRQSVTYKVIQSGDDKGGQENSGPPVKTSVAINKLARRATRRSNRAEARRIRRLRANPPKRRRG